MRLAPQAERVAAAAQVDGEGMAGSQRLPATPSLPVGSHRTRVLLGMPSMNRSAAFAAGLGQAAPGGSPRAGQSAAQQWEGALEEDLTEDAAEDVENLLESYFAQVCWGEGVSW